jgi:hypothetical protein
MIKRIRQWIELRRFKRAFLAAQDRPAVWLAEPVEELGATEQWSPIADVEQAIEHEQEDEARLELAAAAADLKPLLDDFHRAMAKAFRDFDAAMLRPMTTTAKWHMAGRDCCQRCGEQHARTFGAIGERFGIRSFRIDTDTAEYKIYSPHSARELVAA